MGQEMYSAGEKFYLEDKFDGNPESDLNSGYVLMMLQSIHSPGSST